MTDGDGLRPPESAEKPIGEIVSEISDKAALLVREEIELAKAEVQAKIRKLVTGAIAATLGVVFLTFALIYFFHGLAYLFYDLLNWDDNVWAGYGIVFLILLLAGALAGFLAYRFFKRGSPPTPELAIEEAKKTRVALEEARG